MKKLIFVLVLMITAALAANAQDGFFISGEGDSRTGVPGVDEPLIPHGPVGGITSQDAAPLGAGLLIMTALGGVYMLRKRDN